ncbi:hypothetical protein EOD41_05415 [Mucilaginibacter limnophilus]|uniref:Uncharacterized protein n=1 Tax=Mucilaginibacter limnophilus TaxID=1932778 RepID=A0A437MUT7_9SPHI|nr:hypothetical protein [Mucilaginibacter limnophilus]RVU01402.1 hypothetical protein EOD41_05415 [Mucilaginibacter limnophilus]
MTDTFNDTLVGEKPKDWLLHGPTKRLVNNYHWHNPKIGIVASYTPLERDVHDHFGIFRGVDQIESFAQATIVSCATFSECNKMKCTPTELKETFMPIFIGIGNVNYHSYLEKGQTFINIGYIKFYKFRQMVCDGRIYKAPAGLNLDAYFRDFNEERLKAYDLSEDFKLVAELFDITGRAIKKELFNTL